MFQVEVKNLAEQIQQVEKATETHFESWEIQAATRFDLLQSALDIRNQASNERLTRIE